MIALGSDHAGYAYKEKIKDVLKTMNVEFQDFGTTSPDSADYPDYAHIVAQAVSKGAAEFGVLVCGTGIGMSIVANKHEGVRASNVESIEGARMARQHNNANVLTLGAGANPPEVVEDMVLTWLATAFEGGRHQRRVDKIERDA